MKFITDTNIRASFHTVAYENEEQLCECRVNVDGDTWTVSSWYASKGNNNKGYGKATLKACLDEIYKKHGLPKRIEYIWNGTNSYVLDWLNKHFGAISKCPIAVQKYASEDDWDSHIYILNKDKFLNYFEIVA